MVPGVLVQTHTGRPPRDGVLSSVRRGRKLARDSVPVIGQTTTQASRRANTLERNSGKRLAEIGSVPSLGSVVLSIHHAIAETLKGNYKAELQESFDVKDWRQGTGKKTTIGTP